MDIYCENCSVIIRFVYVYALYIACYARGISLLTVCIIVFFIFRSGSVINVIHINMHSFDRITVEKNGLGDVRTTSGDADGDFLSERSSTVMNAT